MLIPLPGTLIKSLKKELLSHLSRNPGGPFTLKQLAKALKVKARDEFHELRATVERLQKDGTLATDKNGRIVYIGRREKVRKEKSHTTNRIIGQLSVTRRGFGFVTIEGTDEEIFIAPKFMKTALHGDSVAVVPFAHPISRHRGRNEERAEGEVVEILERSLSTVVGRLEVSRDFFFVVPDDERVTRDIYVSRDEAIKAKHGDKVVVKLLPWEDEHQNTEGLIIDVLDPSGDARVEVLGVARQFGLPMSFPPAVAKEVEQFPETIPAMEIDRRLDYRNVPTFTIDPEDAKDFDDAISFEPLKGGVIRVGVHIADVSYYVREGGGMDEEALRRGTSVYMVNEVIPMLPERLSNDLCSLRPDLDRLTFSVLMDVTPDGKVQDYRIAKSIIHSVRRFTYEEVQQIIDDGKGELADIIIPLFKLTQTLTKLRRRHGSIDFETPEAKFRFDSQGLPSQIILKVRLGAHRLVEECMLLANKTVAEYIGKVRKEEPHKPFIYRVHDAPDPSRLQDLANFVKQFGYSLDAKQGVSSKALQNLLDSVKGSDVEYVINEVALRSMAKAVYSEKNIGHYGLGFKHYTHFTSPIRRYPDLVVHRLLHEYAGGVDARRLAEIVKRISEICVQSSERERVAVEAERTSVKVMQVEYMKRHTGDELEGVIAGVTNFGLFVEINNLLVEGLVKMRDLLDDYYLFDEKNYSLRGRSRGKVYRLGDRVRVRVVSVNPETREIDFAIAD
ncbi:MAG: ribonuclease R [Ignavibacteriae bacterium]|nr:ribonuclease R [Ignavibacteriota bacterium]